MPIKTSKSYVLAGVTVTEITYESGMIEVSFKTPEVISGAGPVLRAVVSRLAPRERWVLNGRQELGLGRFYTRANAFRAAVDYARKDANITGVTDGL